MADVLGLFKQAETTLQQIDQSLGNSPADSEERYRMLGALFRKRKITILTALLKMAAELRVSFGSRQSWTFNPTFMEPEPFLKRYSGANKHTTVEEVVDGPFFDEVIEEVLEALEGSVGKLKGHSERFQNLGGAVGQVKEDMPLDQVLDLRGGGPLATRVHDKLGRKLRAKRLSDVLQLGFEEIFNVRTIGWFSLAYLFVRLEELGCLEQSKAWQERWPDATQLEKCMRELRQKRSKQK